jgi:transposase-like protein
MSNLSALHFHNEEAAYAYVEERLWANGPVCPHCGGVDRISKMQGKSTRVGAYKCYQCRKPFTVKIGTVFEDSKVPMRLWLQAMYLIAGSKKGISANQLHRVLGVTLKTAWFMSHRIREAMRSGNLAVPFGSDGGAVEVDETYIGFKAGRTPQKGTGHKRAVLALVDRDSGQSRWFHINDSRAKDIHPIVAANISREARLMTDEATMYRKIGRQFAEHGTTTHARMEFVSREDRTIHTNTVEGAFSIFKRGMRGVYQHCAEHHLHRYLAEFEFRYNNRIALGVTDTERSDTMLKGIVGKRLTYQTASARA